MTPAFVQKAKVGTVGFYKEATLGAGCAGSASHAEVGKLNCSSCKPKNASLALWMNLNSTYACASTQAMPSTRKEGGLSVNNA